MILVNFGGPRNLEEVRPFLTELLTDQDVIQTKWPKPLHRWLFGRVAKKRAKTIAPDYAKIGGGSPIYGDTEEIARRLQKALSIPVFPFHRYLPSTHAETLQAIESCKAALLRVLPLFPQFSYATTGSIARFFSERLSRRAEDSLRWIQSYPTHPAFIRCYAGQIRRLNLVEEQMAVLFSCHGLPKAYIDNGDVYQAECRRSFEAISSLFPKAVCRLSYQSKFGRGEWIRPYTDEMCEGVQSWSEGRKVVVIVPLSFTSDHIETLYEIEELYLPILRSKGVTAMRCPALNLEPDWIDALGEIALGHSVHPNFALIRK